MNKKTAQILGALAVLGLGTYVVIRVNKRSKDKKARNFLAELEDLRNPGQGLEGLDAFNVNYLLNVQGSVNKVVNKLADSDAIEIANKIDDAWGYSIPIFGGSIFDAFDKIKGVFRSLKDRVEVSQVSKAYYDTYGTNLIDDLNDKLDSGEVAEIVAIVKEKQAYTFV